MWSQFTAASQIGSITAAPLCLVSAPTCGGGGGGEGGVHGSYSQTAADNHAYISNHHFQEDNLLAWHDTLNSLPSWIQFLIHFFCFAGFVLPIRDVRASVGAGFLYPLVGTVCVFLTYFITSLLCNCYLGLSQRAHREGVCCMTSTKPHMQWPVLHITASAGSFVSTLK